jgi:hypothetical protein
MFHQVHFSSIPGTFQANMEISAKKRTNFSIILDNNFGQGGQMNHRFLIPIVISTFILLFVMLSLYAQPAKAEITAAILVSRTEGLFTDENGSTDSFTIVLDSLPTANVKIDLYSSDVSEGTVSPTSVVFNKKNWNNPQTIEVTGIADGIQDEDVLYQVLGTVSSKDPNFENLEMPAVSITNINDSLPIANDDLPPINGYSPITISVLQNDSGLFDTPLQLGVISDPLFGSYVINPAPENTITYTPSQTFAGFDQFTYSVCDGDGDCSSASVIIEDQSPPTVIWVSPVEIGDTFDVIHGNIRLEVAVEDNFQVDCVKFLRWDAMTNVYIVLDTVCQPPYATTINSNSINLAWNQIFAQATDMAGNYSDFESIWIFRWNHSYIPLLSR